MRVRIQPLATPPDRPPYFVVGGLPSGDLWFRALSSRRLALLVGCVEQRHMTAILAAVAASQAEPGSLQMMAAAMRAMQEAPGFLDVVGAAIGYAWADPVTELEGQPTNDTPAAMRLFGAAVLEELHEAGWTPSQQIGVAMALLDLAAKAWQLEASVRERVALFVGRTATTASPSDSSSGGTSTGSSAPGMA